MASETPTISIKLLIDQESNTVLLAEAGNDFFDTLHSLLKLPLGNIARLADKHQSLQPGPTGYFVCRNELCNRKQDGLFSYYDTPRCTCGKLMNVQTTKLRQSDSIKDETEGVLYKGESMFFITDDLRVMLGFPGDLVQILLNRGIKNVIRIEEKVVEIGSKEMTELLIHSLFSNTTLTDVFLRKQGNRHCTPILDEQFSFIEPKVKESTEKGEKIRVKMMLRKSDGKIVLAEASEIFIDLLFSFLTIPLDSVLELILAAVGNLTLGSISNLFRDLNTIFSISNQKNSQLGVLPPFYSCPNVFPNIRCRDPPEFHFCYTFKSGHRVIESSVVNKPLDPKSQKPSSSNSWGYVEKNSFVVTDDLAVKPLSSISSISLLKETGISLDDVEQKVISIGEVEAIALVGACLWSSSALSSLLNCFAKKPKQEPRSYHHPPDSSLLSFSILIVISMASESPTISIKLLIDQESNVVLLAEAGNDFVDTLHSLLKLPLGNIARLADKHRSLQPVPTGHFVCGNQHCNEKEGGLFSYYDTQRCSCGKLMNVRATILQKCDAIKDETDGVLYMEEAMFFVTDDLRVMQGFPGDLFQFLLNLGFKNASRIDEKVVEIGSKQMTDLLIHSLFSKTTFKRDDAEKVG
ncbi:hypothetical protein V6N12_001144 [Hibiscus sabdariffa]|uniref:DUF674 family protein n=1 Tax=Hibiscus sabdariffa TaxID=183260 RepID=A0ABR2C7Z1_9ROSI